MSMSSDSVEKIAEKTALYFTILALAQKKEKTATPKLLQAANKNSNAVFCKRLTTLMAVSEHSLQLYKTKFGVLSKQLPKTICGAAKKHKLTATLSTDKKHVKIGYKNKKQKWFTLKQNTAINKIKAWCYFKHIQRCTEQSKFEHIAKLTLCKSFADQKKVVADLKSKLIKLHQIKL